MICLNFKQTYVPVPSFAPVITKSKERKKNSAVMGCECMSIDSISSLPVSNENTYTCSIKSCGE